MFVRIKFNQDVYIVVQDSIDSMPYPAKYKRNEIESVDILEKQGGTMYVQFEDGSVGWIKNRHVEITHIDLEE